MRSNRCNLNEIFFRHFDVRLVSSAEQEDDAARIRHRVFSEECGFEPVAQCGRESDVYDKNSQQCLIYHRGSGLPAACVRVIFPKKYKRMAIEDLCRDLVHVQYREKIAERPNEVCEVSRFAVDPAFRRAPANGFLEIPGTGRYPLSDMNRAAFSALSTVALLAALAIAEQNGRQWLFSVMEPRTPRLIRLSAGVQFEQAGEPFEHFGTVVPYCVSSDDAVDQLRSEFAPVYQTVKYRIGERDVGRHGDRQALARGARSGASGKIVRLSRQPSRVARAV